MSKMFEIDGQVVIPHVFTKLASKPNVWVYWDGADSIGYYRSETTTQTVEKTEFVPIEHHKE